MRTSGEAIPHQFDLWQQRVDFLAAAELVFRDGPRETVDAACLSAVFAIRLLIRAALGDRDPADANLPTADLFGRLDRSEQNAIVARVDVEHELGLDPLVAVQSQILTWVVGRRRGWVMPRPLVADVCCHQRGQAELRGPGGTHPAQNWPARSV